MKTALLALLVMLVSCTYNTGPSTYKEQDITFTYQDTTFDVTTYTTFTLPDSVNLTENYLKDHEIDLFYSEGGLSDILIDTLATRFVNLGYVLVDSVQNADFVLNPTVLLVKSVSGGYVPIYPGYPGYYPPYWGYYYYEYNEGTLEVDLIDRASLDSLKSYHETVASVLREDEEEIIKVRWVALIDGVLSNDKDYNAERYLNGIEEAFAQSPYLQKN